MDMDSKNTIRRSKYFTLFTFSISIKNKQLNNCSNINGGTVFEVKANVLAQAIIKLKRCVVSNNLLKIK